MRGWELWSASHGARSCKRPGPIVIPQVILVYRPWADGPACLGLCGQGDNRDLVAACSSLRSPHTSEATGLGKLGTEESREQQAEGWAGFLGKGCTAAVTLKGLPQSHLLTPESGGPPSSGPMPNRLLRDAGTIPAPSRPTPIPSLCPEPYQKWPDTPATPSPPTPEHVHLPQVRLGQDCPEGSSHHDPEDKGAPPLTGLPPNRQIPKVLLHPSSTLPGEREGVCVHVYLFARVHIHVLVGMCVHVICVCLCALGTCVNM